MMRSELDRKSIHIFSALIPISFLFLPYHVLYPLLSAATLIFISVDLLRRHLPPLRSLFSFFAAWAMREEEEKRFRLTGATWMMLAETLILGLFDLQIAVASLLVLHWSDAAAALIGKHWGRHRWTGNYTVEGTLAFILTGIAVLSFGFPQLPLFLSLTAVITAALAESLIKNIDDNLVIPLTMALILSLPV